MKIRNKKTGEIAELGYIASSDGHIILQNVNTGEFICKYGSLAELNEEWEDAPEEPKEYWFLSGRGEVKCIEDENTVFNKDHKSIGNYFESREEAEKAVEKLKALKRLKDNGFEFEGWTIDDGLRISICTNFDSDGIYDEDRKEAKKDLDICFGGEE